MEIRVLGPLQVVHPTGPVPLKGLRQRAVLAVLVIEAGRVLSSDQLAELVWDGAPPQQAQVSLQAYISKLRRALEPDRDGRSRPWEVLVTRPPGYVLAVEPGVIDAVRFERACDEAADALRAGRPAEALGLLDEGLGWWRGEPYADFVFAGFARNEIARLTELHWRALEDRADARLALGRHRDVVADLESLVRQAPLRERLRGQLMLALYRSGRQADALACLHEGRAVLVDELGLDPGPDLRRLERAILEHDGDLDWTPPTGDRPAPVAARVPASSGAAPRVGDGRVPMIGRERERDHVAGVLERTAAGHGALVLVCGEAGIGKTRLAEEAAELADHQGLTVAWGRCPELEGVPPFWPWVQVLRTLVQVRPDAVVDPVLATLVPELSAGRAPTDATAADATPAGDGLTNDTEAARFRLYDAVARLLAAESRRRPLLVLLEDLHWADAASLRLLHFLAPDLPRGPLTVLATLRDHDGPDALHDLRAQAARLPGADRLDLHHLDRDGVGALTRALAREPVPPAVVDTLARRSGGNPFFLGELIRLGLAGPGGVPGGVRDVIQRRVAGLEDATRQVLTLASCFPGDVPLDTLAAVLGRPPIDVLDQIDVALAARLLTEVPDRVGSFRFSHPLVREALYDQLSALRRAHLHGAIAEHLQRRVGPDGTGAVDDADDELVAQLAHHFTAAAPTGTVAEAVRWSLLAGHRDLRRWAADAARDHFEGALALARGAGGVDDAALVALLTGAGRARRFLGDATSRDALAEAMAVARKTDQPVGAVTAALASGLDAWGFGSAFGIVDEDLCAILEWALPRLDRSLPTQRALHILGTTCLAAETIFDPDQDRAARLAEPEPLAAALTGRWIAVWDADSAPERRALLDRLDGLVRARELDPARLLLLRSADALEQADRPALDAALAEAETVVGNGRHPALELLIAWRRSLLAILDGHFEEAEALIGAAHERAQQANPRDALDASGGQLTLLYWQWDRIGELAPLLAAAADDQPYLRPAFGVVHALALTHAGQPDEARAVMAGLGLPGPGRPPTALLRSGTVTALIATARALDDPDLARYGLRLLGDDDRAAPAVTDHVGVFYCGARAGFRGVAHLVTGDLDAAVTALETGMAVNRRMGAVVHGLRTQLDLAEALVRRNAPGDRARLGPLLEAADTAAAGLGLAGDRSRAAALASGDLD
jgi:DNA-binding SARP family transcriptional activator